MARDSVTLWRPVGPAELGLIRASGMRAFPPIGEIEVIAEFTA
jgi:hypothetical protein